MTRAEVGSLHDFVDKAVASPFLYDRKTNFCLTDLARGSSLGGRHADLCDRSVLLATENQLTTALALIELDGRARRIIVLPPDFETGHLSAVIAAADADAIVFDRDPPPVAGIFSAEVRCAASIVPITQTVPVGARTEWVLMTSGTTGVPKMVLHDLRRLTNASAQASPADGATVWGTFYDIRRYGGLQILLRAVVAGASLVLSSAGEPVADHLSRLARHGVTHLSGTPSHWRRALMDPSISRIAPRYVRLSGEIADQGILDALRATFPTASIGHAYASTEAGVAFDVNDGLAGFPATYLECVRNGVEMRLVDGSLRIRSTRTASRYIGTQEPLVDVDGFVDTGDIIERRDDRCYFVGRKGGIINVGGLKVHPEEVEAVINQHPQVRISLVRPRQSPITGTIVIADVVLKPESGSAGDERGEIQAEILKRCREALARHKVPAAISFVPSLAVAATGKLSRRYG